MTPTLEKEEAPAATGTSPETPEQPEAIEQPEATETVATKEPEQTAYSFEATTKRVAASGDSFQIVLEMSGTDWLRYVSAGLHKDTNTVIVKPHQQRWEPPTGTANLKPAAECFFDEGLQAYQCKERPWSSSQEPCEHVLAETAAELEDEQPSENGNGHGAPKWYGRRLIAGKVVEGKEPCPNVECGRRAPKEGESHECRSIQVLNPAPESVSVTPDQVPF